MTSFSRKRFKNNLHAQALAKTHGVSVPKILFLSKNFSYAETFFRGHTFFPGINKYLCKKNSSVFRKIITHLAQELSQLHQIKNQFFSEGVLQPSNISWKQVLCNRTKRLCSILSKKHRKNSALILKIKVALFREIKKLSIEPVPALTHFDLNPGNILIGTSGNIHLIDWECARFYDPLWDVATVQALLKNSVSAKAEAEFSKQYFKQMAPDKESQMRIYIYNKLQLLRELP